MKKKIIAVVIVIAILAGAFFLFGGSDKTEENNEKRESDRKDVLAGILSPWEYRERWYGEGIDIALEKVQEMYSVMGTPGSNSGNGNSGTQNPGDSTDPGDSDLPTDPGNSSSEPTEGSSNGTGGNTGSTSGNTGSTGGGTTKPANSKPSTTAEILNYFNTAINDIKPNAKSITLNKLVNGQTTPIDLNGNKTLQKIADPLVSSNMGEDESVRGKVATSRADKNAMFPMEGESWSSKLEVKNIKSATLKEANGVYTITVVVKDDAPSASTVKGYGNHGKAFPLVDVPTILDNAGVAKGMLKDVKTGHSNGKIVLKVDAATGHVTSANYYNDWTLSLTALGIAVKVTFNIIRDFTIKW